MYSASHREFTGYLPAGLNSDTKELLIDSLLKDMAQKKIIDETTVSEFESIPLKDKERQLSESFDIAIHKHEEQIKTIEQSEYPEWMYDGY